MNSDTSLQLSPPKRNFDRNLDSIPEFQIDNDINFSNTNPPKKSKFYKSRDNSALQL
jgi:hypothetical protein